MRRNVWFVDSLFIPGAALAAFACGGGDLVLPDDREPAAIAAVRGEEQTGTVGSPLTDSIVVRVTDAAGRPLAGLPVEFVVPPGGSAGEVIPDTARTGGDGLAGAEWVLGEQAGSQVLDARVAGAGNIAVRFTASARAAMAHAIVALSGDEQSAPVGTALLDSLVVQVNDEFGNPVSGAPVEWSAEPGSISPGTVETDAAGRAAARRVLGTTAGAQTAAASAAQLDGSPVIFTHMATAGSAASLVLVSGSDQSAAPGAELAEPLVVRLVDAEGNGIGDQAVTWIIGVGGGSVSPTTGQTDGEGLSSALWTLGPSQGPNTVNAVVSGLGVVTFTASATSGGGGGGGGAERLVFQVQPSDARRKERITPPVVVAVVDRNGDLVQESGIKIAIELSSGSGKLEGKREKDTKNGIVVFDDLKVTEPGDGKVLRASAPGEAQLGTVESRPFRIEK
ncbi:MAG: Ig-like domain-containing protein [Gemmatimonadales bacterium]